MGYAEHLLMSSISNVVRCTTQATRIMLKSLKPVHSCIPAPMNKSPLFKRCRLHLQTATRHRRPYMIHRETHKSNLSLMERAVETVDKSGYRRY